MLAIYASTALILLASLVLGRAILSLLRWPSPAWLSGATGFAALVVIAPFAIRLPGRATTASILLGVLLVIAALVAWRKRAGAPRSRTPGPEVAGATPAPDTPRIGAPPASDRPRIGAPPAPDTPWIGLAVVAITLALATLPFVFNERIGILGEGIYTNDHAAQLYWADWLQNGFGPQPNAVQFGYPIGPQAVAAVAAEATGTTLVESFNGLMLAIPALTGLAALGALGALAPLRRIAIASICALPYLAASFLAQTAFKETAMALFVLAFAIALASLGRERGGDAEDPGTPWHAVAGVGLILAAASVFTFSLPGLAWFVIALPLWLVAEALAGRSPVDWGGLGEWLSRNRVAVAIGAVVLVAGAVIAIGPAANFIEKINDVQASAGRLSSPVFPGEAFGIWPEGDFRIVRGEVSGALLAVAVGVVAAGYGVLTLARRRELALLAMLAAGAIVYIGARLFAEIHVEAKALAVISPLILLVGLRALLGPPAGGEQRATTVARYALGAGVLVAATLSTLLALRAAPVGFDDRAAGLERLAERIEGESVAFLGVDRFAGYRLRGTLARAPAGYVPEEIAARPEKVWQQGQAADFDTLDSGKLDKFRYAITTTAAYASAAPQNFEPVLQSGDYVLWRRRGETPRSRVLDEGPAPGVRELCSAGEGQPPGREAVASVFAVEPALAEHGGWSGAEPVEPAAGGQENAFLAPATVANQLDLARAGEYALSLQYHSQASLEVLVAGEVVAELPPSLDGMYLDGAGRGAFWPAGVFEAAEPGVVEVEVRAAEPSGLQDALGIERRVWLGDLAATSTADPVTRTITGACGPYIDHFRYLRGGAG